MTEDGFTVVQTKKRKQKRKFEETVQTKTESDGAKRVRKVEFREEKVTEKAEVKAITKVLALDCEYVGVGVDGKTDSLARVSIVNVDGAPVYDKYVSQTEKVTDFRTEVSGIRPGHLTKGKELEINGKSSLSLGEPFNKIQQEVHKMLADRIVVGHALHNDFRVLNLTHPRRLTRDTAKYKPLRALAKSTRTPSLKYLAKEILDVQIQQGEHDSVGFFFVLLSLPNFR